MPLELLLLVAACQDPDSPVDTGEPEPAAPPAWTEEAALIDCPVGSVEGPVGSVEGPVGSVEAPLLDAALLDAGLEAGDVGYTESDWEYASYGRYLEDPFLLSWFRPAISAPLLLPCRGAQQATDLDFAATSDHPVSAALGVAMGRLDHVTVAVPLDPREATQSLVDLSDLPADLGEALVPIFSALQEIGRVRDALDETAPLREGKLVKFGHGGVLLDTEAAPDLTDASVQDWLLAEDGPRSLYDPARVLAFAIEDADLERFEGQDISWSADSDLGPILITGPGDDAPGDIGMQAFHLDTGGNDTWIHEAGANSRSYPVSVHIDLSGNDTYGYEERDAGDDALLPSDSEGRYSGDENYGTFSLSNTGRQGSGRYGVGFLFDLGGDDHYQSLRASQGWGHLGVGALLDAAGDDTYLGEAGVQGAGSLGVGLFLDLEGDDLHKTFTNSQGFGYVAGAGIAWDGGGDDTWYANPGKSEDGGLTLYYSPQLPGNGNSGFSQGVGFGMRNDAATTFLSGGVGVLRDLAGDDDYTAGTFAQGSGYWQGTGYFLEGGGSDIYDAYYYVQGGAAHYAIGVFLDDGDGDDALNTRMTPNHMQVGAGHDFSVGVHVNEGGDDTYVFGGLAAGASNCQGIGLFVDNDGADSYTANSTLSVGLGNHSGECESRDQVDSIGLFLDGGGDADQWAWPAEDIRSPGDDASFGIRWNGTDDEFGGAVDGDGETSLHSGGVLP
jgi:hypothetical protein